MVIIQYMLALLFDWLFQLVDQWMVLISLDMEASLIVWKNYHLKYEINSKWKNKKLYSSQFNKKGTIIMSYKDDTKIFNGQCSMLSN